MENKLANTENNDKYMEALSKYNTNLNDADIKAETEALLDQRLTENDNIDVKKFLFNCIDLTTLKSTDSDKSIMDFTNKVNLFVDKYPDLKNVAAICV